jgi:hypothetical protein
MVPPARSRQQRKLNALTRLESDVDAWIATVDETNSTPYLVPLSFLWDGNSLLISTPASTQTGRNLQQTGTVRVGIGPTRDVVLIEGTVAAIAPTELPEEIGNAFATKTGFDPRQEVGNYLYFRIHPQRMQAWRESNEQKGRTIMWNGQWVVD